MGPVTSPMRCILRPHGVGEQGCLLPATVFVCMYHSIYFLLLDWIFILCILCSCHNKPAAPQLQCRVAWTLVHICHKRGENCGQSLAYI